MSKTYIVSRNGGTVTKAPINDNKIPIYANETALDADLANIPDNTLVATRGGHDDVIDQMKDYIRKQNSPDWSNAEDITTAFIASMQTGYTINADGWIVFMGRTNSYTVTISINNTLVANSQYLSGIDYGRLNENFKVSKNDIVTGTGLTDSEAKVLFVPHK